MRSQVPFQPIHFALAMGQLASWGVICAFSMTLLAENVAPVALSLSVSQDDEAILGQPIEDSFARNIEIPLTDRLTRNRLEQADALLSGGRFDEAVAIYVEIMNAEPEGVLQVSANRYMNVRRGVTLRLASLSSEGLAAYRTRVDSSAQIALERAESSAEWDPTLWQELVDVYPLSSCADEAIDRLAQISLERGDFATARVHWESLLPTEVEQSVSDTRTSEDAFPSSTANTASWFAYPDSNIPPEEIRARLLELSILEGDVDRASMEIEIYESLHPDAEIIRRGQAGNASSVMRSTIDQSRVWADSSSDRASEVWTTFGGNPTRCSRNTSMPTFGNLLWNVQLPPIGRERGTIFDFSESLYCEILSFDEDTVNPSIDPRPSDPALVYFPAAWKELLFVAGSHEIYAYNQRTGRPAWGMDSPIAYQAPKSESHPEQGISPCMVPPRFSLTIHNDSLYAKMGSVTTAFAGTPPSISDAGAYGGLICLDLAAQGRISWTIPIIEPGDAFEGAPLADDESVYVAMRRTDVTSRSYVACFDAKTGSLRWRTFVCASEPEGRGRVPEASRHLLTLQGETLYFNTNGGAVAAINRNSGEIRWLTTYPRAVGLDPTHPSPHQYRTLTPCLYHKHRLYVAPSDAPGIFAIDALDGRILWNTSDALADATHLLGVVDNVLIASGDRLYWIGLQGAEAGGILSRWPESSDAVGRGRGIVAGNAVYWPTRRGILVFDASKRTMIREYPLAQLGIESGNLTCLNGLTFITGGRSLTAFAENDQDPGREVERTPAEETPRNEFEENAGPLTYRQPNYRRN
jgi:cellulose synthase operon protein C